MKLPLEKLSPRIDKAWAVKELWRPMLEQAYQYALPQRNLYTRQEKGGSKTDRVFDSTAILSTIRFANRLQSDLTPPFQKWAKLQPGSAIPKEKKAEAAGILDSVSETLFSAISMSNFDTAINELYLDLATGTGAMLILEGDDEKPIRFVSVPNAQIALEEGPWGEIWSVFRKHPIKPRNIIHQWPDATIPEDLQERVDSDKDDEVTVDEITYFDPEDKIWRYEVLWGKTENNKNATARLVERTYKVSPWVTPRWIKISGEVFGRGPLLTALPDIKTLNAVVELILKNASLAVAGIFTGVDDGVLNPNTVKVVPGAVIAVANNGGPKGASLQPLDRAGSFDVAQFILKEMRESVKAMMMDKTLPPDTASPRSATEIVERMKELQQDIGSPFGRLMTELIRPVINRSLSILSNRGLIQGEIVLNDLLVKISVTSPLAQTQNLSDIQSVVQWIQIVQSLGPQIMMLGARVEDIPEYIGDKMGTPTELMRTREERDQMQKMIGQQAANQLQEGGIGVGEVTQAIAA